MNLTFTVLTKGGFRSSHTTKFPSLLTCILSFLLFTGTEVSWKSFFLGLKNDSGVPGRKPSSDRDVWIELGKTRRERFEVGGARSKSRSLYASKKSEVQETGITK